MAFFASYKTQRSTQTITEEELKKLLNPNNKGKKTPAPTSNGRPTERVHVKVAVVTLPGGYVVEKPMHTKAETKELKTRAMTYGTSRD